MIRHVEGNIRITQVPQGEAPLEVRKKWVGVILPVIAISDSDCRGILSKKKTGRRSHYSVPQEAAISALKKSAPEAAAWWEKNGFPQEDHCFTFSLDEAEVVGELKEAAPKKISPFWGLLEVGVGAHDHPANN